MASNFGKLLDGMELTLNNQASARQVVELDLDRISSDPNNPRQNFDETALKELAQSIEERGVIQPIMVRRAEEEGRFIVKVGDRRFRAAQLAGLSTIPAIVSEESDGAELLVDQVIENDQRADLSAGEMATAVARLIDAGMRQSEVAKKLGRPKGLISMYAAVRTMPEFLSALTGTLAIRTVYELHNAWKLDGARVEALVTERAGAPIAIAEARALVADIEDRASQTDKSLSEQTSEEPPAPPVETPAPTRRKKASAAVAETPPLFVEVDGRRGRLVLTGKVEVLFDGSDTAEAIDASAIRPAVVG